MFRELFLTGLGGAAGCMARYLTSAWVSRCWATTFPLPTLIVNLSGCLLIGLLLGWFEHKQITGSGLRFLLITGFCGGYTTFSAFSAENMRLLQAGQTGTALGYVLLSVCAGITATWLGYIALRP